ncbi:hypothetical protein JCM18237_27980 [Halorubrum luteum]
MHILPTHSLLGQRSQNDPQLVWLDGLFALVALRKEARFTFHVVFDEGRSRWDGRPAERTGTEFRRCIRHGRWGRNLERVT